jgi:hypothetical protein
MSKDPSKDSGHRAVRERLSPLVSVGVTRCSICGERILPGQPWDLDHAEDRASYRGPAHRSCNRREGGIRGNKSPKRHRPQSRAW